jgi:hypothetical protein
MGGLRSSHIKSAALEKAKSRGYKGA